jgi:hypothetical protein
MTLRLSWKRIRANTDFIIELLTGGEDDDGEEVLREP